MLDYSTCSSDHTAPSPHPAIPKRIQRGQCSCQGAGLADRLAPSVVSVFYHPCAVCVNQRNHVALEVVHVSVGGTVKEHDDGFVLRIVKEVQGVAAAGQVDDVLPVQGVFRGLEADIPGSLVVVHAGLLRAQAVLVVPEGNLVVAGCVEAAFVHAAHLASLRLGVIPGTVIKRIANSVIGDGSAVERRQLVLPVRVPVGIAVRLYRRADRVGLFIRNAVIVCNQMRRRVFFSKQSPLLIVVWIVCKDFNLDIVCCFKDYIMSCAFPNLGNRYRQQTKNRLAKLIIKQHSFLISCISSIFILIIVYTASGQNNIFTLLYAACALCVQTIFIISFRKYPPNQVRTTANINELTSFQHIDVVLSFHF